MRNDSIRVRGGSGWQVKLVCGAAPASAGGGRLLGTLLANALQQGGGGRRRRLACKIVVDGAAQGEAE
jgi:hypothetical protein